MAASPLVTVITGAHNAEAYLPRTVESVLRQSFTNFEYIVVDDGSTDGGPEYLRGLGDPRLRLFQPGKIGRSASLNLALAEARGEFVAVLDADDLCRADRLELQAARMLAEPELMVLGSACRLVDEDDRPFDHFANPLNHACILWQLLFHNGFVHSSAMYRLEAVRRLGLAYETDLEPAEDYAFLASLAWHGRAANDERPLVDYRVHQAQLSQARAQIQQDRAWRIVRRHLARAGFAGEPPAHARDWFWGLPVEPRAEHGPLLDFYLSLLDMVERKLPAEDRALDGLRTSLARSREGLPDGGRDPAVGPGRRKQGKAGGGHDHDHHP